MVFPLRPEFSLASLYTGIPNHLDLPAHCPVLPQANAGLPPVASDLAF
jgi:hypothetical protein